MPGDASLHRSNVVDSLSLDGDADLLRAAEPIERKYFEVTKNGALRRFWKKTPLYRPSSFVTFALVPTNDKNFDPLSLVRMEYRKFDRKFFLKKLVPLPVATISVQRKDRTVSLQLDNGESHMFWLYKANYHKDAVMDYWETLSSTFHQAGEDLAEDEINTLFLEQEKPCPTVNISLNDCHIKGDFDTGAPFSLISSCSQADLRTDLPDWFGITTGSDGNTIPITGYFIADVSIRERVHKNKIFIVSDKLATPLILGVNIIMDFYKDVDLDKEEKDVTLICTSHEAGETLTENEIETIFMQQDKAGPTVNISINDVSIEGVFDTGSAFSLLSRKCFLCHWSQKHLKSLPSDYSELITATCEPDPMDGCFIADVEVGGHVYKNRMFMITSQQDVPLIVGMNIISECYKELDLDKMMMCCS
ncbi:uncharacterized protein [Hyperolius riggenbachi]|uniref:uncharacterized protein n=1 Tax=Hyperolius riggenbachi TaxID=752182 RepID=UPI0035A2D91A